MSLGFATAESPTPRPLRFAAVVTLTLLFALLTLGAFVTSFQVGMADKDWPTRPWHLAEVNMQDAGFGYLVEHSHRLAGFVVGGVVSLLALGLWWTEPRPLLRWVGMIAIVGLLAAFGQLHGTLLKHQTELKETAVLTAPDWSQALSPTLVALGIVQFLAIVGAATGPRGSGLRLLGVLLLVGVMAQGILGGLRVYLNALLGQELATIHGVFSQIVMAMAVTLVVLTRPRRDDGWHPTAALLRVGLIAAASVFAQIVAGAVLRHTASPLGPRLHLIGAFIVIFATATVSRRSRATPIRFLSVLAASLAGIQILLGVEAWMIRFKSGFAMSALQQITMPEAILRTLHALVGYGLFATTVALAVVLLRNREPRVRPVGVNRLIAHEEALA
jgi:cytochrome c oxidase assembly protein subunit 15